MKELMSAPEAARALGYTLQYVYGLLVAGKIPASKVDGQWQIEAKHVRARIAQMERRNHGTPVER